MLIGNCSTVFVHQPSKKYHQFTALSAFELIFTMCENASFVFLLRLICVAGVAGAADAHRVYFAFDVIYHGFVFFSCVCDVCLICCVGKNAHTII